MSENEDDEPLIETVLGEYGIRIQLPELFECKVTVGKDHSTWLFWDEDSGSLRITPWRMTSPSFALEHYLSGVLDEKRADGFAADWQELGGRRWVKWIKDNDEEGTRSHFFVGGERDLVIACSWAYDREQLDEEEYGAMMLEGATEDVMRALATLQLG
jgi:hypothetical protein